MGPLRSSGRGGSHWSTIEREVTVVGVALSGGPLGSVVNNNE